MKKHRTTAILALMVFSSLIFQSSCSHTTAALQQPLPEEVVKPPESMKKEAAPQDPRIFVEDMLVSKGHTRSVVHAMIQDQRVKITPGVMVTNMFYAAPAPSPKNPKIMEVDPKYIGRGLDFIDAHWEVYDDAWEQYKVSAEVITAILIIETRLGNYPMKYNVFNVYASLTTLMDSEFLATTLKARKDRHELTEEVITSARKKGNWGLGELSALLRLSEKLGIDPVSIYGSYAGAIGHAQFIPTSFVKFGVDGNKDGKADPFDMDDCIASIANYLKLSGWKEDASIERKRKAIWNYNHHDVYVNTIMMLYDKLKIEGEQYYEKEDDEDQDEDEIQAEGGVQENQNTPLPNGKGKETTLTIPLGTNGEKADKPEDAK